MSQMSKCDKCGTMQENKRNHNCAEGWTPIRYTIQYNYGVSYDFCPDCANALRLPKQPSETNEFGDRFVEFLTELVDNATEGKE